MAIPTPLALRPGRIRFICPAAQALGLAPVETVPVEAEFEFESRLGDGLEKEVMTELPALRVPATSYPGGPRTGAEQTPPSAGHLCEVEGR